MTLNKVIKNTFEKGNVMVVGERGSGKDMLFANVIARRNLAYISNCDYPKKKGIPLTRYELDFSKIDCGGNTYKNFLNKTVKKYIYPYPKGVDIYITDCGVYLPSQFCNELNRDYKQIATFAALSRQLGKCNIFTNTQAYGRIYDKLREQAKRYITCTKCKVYKIGKEEIVFQTIRIYERAESCEKDVPPLRLPITAFIGKEKTLARLYKLNYQIQHGKIEEYKLIYRNKSDYNTDIFEKILKEGEENEE